MAPLPGVPKKSRSDDDEPTVQKSESHHNSPFKRTKKEPEEELLDYGEGPIDERSDSAEFESRTRKKVPITLRLGNISQMATADTARFYKRLDNLDKQSSPGSSSTGSVGSNSSRSYFEPELDQQVLDRRQKQIDYGKATPEYKSYSEAVPRTSRTPQHPKTPNMARKYSRRAWDGLIRQWRLQLHYWNKTSEEIELENRRRTNNLNDSFCSEASGTTGSTSTASSTMGDDEGDKTVVVKTEMSWYEEVEESFEYEETCRANLNKTLEQASDDEEETVRVRL